MQKAIPQALVKTKASDRPPDKVMKETFNKKGSLSFLFY